MYAVVEGKGLIKLNSEGEKEWSIEFGGDEEYINFNEVEVDNDGNVYAINENKNLYMYDSDGNKIWNIETTSDSSFRGLLVDDRGNIYTSESDNDTLYKYDSGGELLWEHELSFDISDIDIDNEGNLYITSRYSDVIKISQEGYEPIDDSDPVDPDPPEDQDPIEPDPEELKEIEDTSLTLQIGPNPGEHFNVELIEDADIAKEMVSMSKQQILSQAGTAILAQANQIPQGIMQLIN
ncbi:flagellin [Halanaerobium hydrogeniformans]|uniref:Flagellin domain protein n=1 Tax=Halanaerobium hydrogeniformans TaxID=656519 RepID=E4RPI8_HALHG|nr:flagellin [Halanaerobium hydrogeniformans]ADQ14011.1 flagellin domain protein [Halanaerobium hydrogeniformans]